MTKQDEMITPDYLLEALEGNLGATIMVFRNGGIDFDEMIQELHGAINRFHSKTITWNDKFNK